MAAGRGPNKPARPPSQTPEVEETKMRKLGIVLAALACLSFVVVPVASAAGFNWGVGANLGFNMFTPDSKYAPYDKTETSFGWPTGGLRFSFAGEKPMHEVYVETLLSSYSIEDGYTLRNIMLTGNYQFNFDMKGPAVPYLTAGAGVNMYSYSPHEGDDTSASSIMYGGGIGVAHHMGNGCGRLRAEVRYDMIGEGKDGESVEIAKGGLIGIKLGFDLWDKK
jgi:hypothetical protein